jgi:hypothetical protein
MLHSFQSFPYWRIFMNQNQRHQRDARDSDAEKRQADEQNETAAAKSAAADAKSGEDKAGTDKRAHPDHVDATTAAERTRAKKEAESQPKGQPQQSAQTRNQGGAHPNG